MRARDRAALIAAAALVVVSIAGCRPAQLPAEQRTPSTVGIVASDAVTDAAGTSVRLVDGQVLTVPQWATSAIVGRPAQEGDLLLGGTVDGRQWVAALSPSPSVEAPDGCYELIAQGHDDGPDIVTDVGLRLPRAPGFDPGLSRNGEYNAPKTAFCVNEEGQVISYGW